MPGARTSFPLSVCCTCSAFALLPTLARQILRERVCSGGQFSAVSWPAAEKSRKEQLHDCSIPCKALGFVTQFCSSPQVLCVPSDEAGRSID